MVRYYLSMSVKILWLVFQVEKELQKAAAEEKRIRQELEKAKKIEDEKKRQVSVILWIMTVRGLKIS